MAIFPGRLFIIRRDDGSLAIAENEEAVAAPVGQFGEMATYTLENVEEVRRTVVLERKPKPPNATP